VLALLTRWLLAERVRDHDGARCALHDHVRSGANQTKGLATLAANIDLGGTDFVGEANDAITRTISLHNVCLAQEGLLEGSVDLLHQLQAAVKRHLGTGTLTLQTALLAARGDTARAGDHGQEEKGVTGAVGLRGLNQGPLGTLRAIQAHQNATLASHRDDGQRSLHVLEATT